MKTRRPRKSAAGVSVKEILQSPEPILSSSRPSRLAKLTRPESPKGSSRPNKGKKRMIEVDSDSDDDEESSNSTISTCSTPY